VYWDLNHLERLQMGLSGDAWTTKAGASFCNEVQSFFSMRERKIGAAMVVRERSMKRTTSLLQLDKDLLAICILL
jgi:hypothetical protein